MFNYKHLHAIALRMFVTFLAANIAKVNELIIAGFSDPKVLRISLFELNSVVVSIVRVEGKLTLNIVVPGYDTHRIKLGNLKAPISKRVVTDLQVYFHREYRLVHEDALKQLAESIDLADVKYKARNIPVVARLFNKVNEFNIRLDNQLMSELLNVTVFIRRSIFNKLTVVVVTHTPEPVGLIREVMPVHVGVTNTYLADGQSDPVNQWFRQVLTDHVDTFAK